MRDELHDLLDVIERSSLPVDFDQIFSKIWDEESQSFHAQENTLLDFKEFYSENYTDSYGIGIVRCAIAFHNTYGGLIVFGVKDRTFTITGVPGSFEIERFNRVLSDYTGTQIECLTKTYSPSGSSPKLIGVVLVPRRGFRRPVVLTQHVGKYLAGTLWVRDRHEVLEASPRHLPLLYSARSPRDSPGLTVVPIHRSLPPSAATVRDFVGRRSLLKTLWDWLIFGDQPRAYLDGPGGSGKTTLAFEFCRSLAEADAEFLLPKGEHLDYVVFISGKETELNPQTGKQQRFTLRNFATAHEQIGQILFHSGMLDLKGIEEASETQLQSLIEELFMNFNGLIVVDDSDTLIRQRKDTGEEFLFLKAATCQKRTRTLYTLRFPPTYALRNSITVPGLNHDDELIPFVDTCCKQFGVPLPTNEQFLPIYDASSGLPLIIESIIWIRKFAGNYPAAINEYKDRGGDDARRYLYQREYDHLQVGGKSQYVLALLYLINYPVSFSTIVSLSNYTSDQIRSSLTECGGIFLTTTVVDEGGETLYQLTPPCIPFVRQVSQNLPFFEKLKRIVEQFKTHGKSATAEESAIIVTLGRMLRQGQYKEILALEAKHGKHDPILANPNIRSLIGAAYCELDPEYREAAREHFRAAESVGFHDVKMMRRWYYLELMSGYGLSKAEKICRIMIGDKNLSPRFHSEFYSKLGNCYMFAANNALHTDREKAISNFKSSIVAYLDALRAGGEGSTFSLSETVDWLEKPFWKLFHYCKDDIDVLLRFIEALIEERNDIPLSAANVVMQIILNISAPRTRDGRMRIRNFCKRMIGKINKSARPLSKYPGLASLIDPLDKIRTELEGLELE